MPQGPCCIPSCCCCCIPPPICCGAAFAIWKLFPPPHMLPPFGLNCMPFVAAPLQAPPFGLNPLLGPLGLKPSVVCGLGATGCCAIWPEKLSGCENPCIGCD